jgi:TusA-related sulfurtransferase
MKADGVIDVKGQICPLPIINLFRAIKSQPKGYVAELHSTCPSFYGDLMAWCRRTMNELLEIKREGKLSVAYIKKT